MSPKVCLLNDPGGAVNPCQLLPSVIQRSCVERGDEHADLSKFGLNLGRESKILFFMEAS